MSLPPLCLAIVFTVPPTTRLSTAGADIILSTPSSSNASLIQYRLLGGTLDLSFFSGPDPNAVVAQYAGAVGAPAWQPMWAFGFHLCRWGYSNLSEVREQVSAMRGAGVPLEGASTVSCARDRSVYWGRAVMWNDIDLYHSLRDFTSDPVSYPPEEMRAFTRELVRPAA